MNSSEKKEELKRILEREGVRAGLMYLNQQSSHRFSALYRFDDKMLKNLYLFDRENPAVNSMSEIPVLASYCVFVRDSGRKFCVEHAKEDTRVAGHPKRLEIQAYCGVPLLDRYGKMFGTVCHFDVDPRQTETADIELMEHLADVLQDRVDLQGGVL